VQSDWVTTPGAWKRSGQRPGKTVSTHARLQNNCPWNSDRNRTKPAERDQPNETSRTKPAVPNPERRSVGRATRCFTGGSQPQPCSRRPSSPTPGLRTRAKRSVWPTSMSARAFPADTTMWPRTLGVTPGSQESPTGEIPCRKRHRNNLTRVISKDVPMGIVPARQIVPGLAEFSPGRLPLGQ